MRLGRVALAIAMVGAVGVACSAFSADSDEPPPPPSEAGDASNASDSSDAAAQIDGTAPPDAAADASFCETADAQFCWSFDGTPPLYGPLLLNATNTGMPPTVAADAGLSPPNAMAVSASFGVAGVRLANPQAVDYLRCDLDIRFDRFEPDGGAEAFSFVQFDYPSSNSNLPALVATRVDNMTVKVSMTFNFSLFVDLGNVAIGEWAHAFMDAEVVNGNWIIRGEVIKDTTKAVDAGARAKLPTFDRLFWGAATLNGLKDTHLLMDNLVCRWR